MQNILNNLSIYLHWPFCKSKCPYCDFFSQVKKNINQDAIISEYINQLDKYAQILPNKHIVSVFFGGGTPSLIKPSNINNILQKIDKLWGIDNKCEISLEANPNTNSPTLFQDLRLAGINRLSLGVQSLNDDELKFLGRTHSSKEALDAIDCILKNFNNHSADLIYALPNQTTKKWLQQLEKITSLGLKHISLYQLTIEENTLFYRKGIKPLCEKKATELYKLTEINLSSKGYLKYEVSNYAQHNYESKHNLGYWTGRDYIGIGQTAHGRISYNNKFFAVSDPILLEELTPQQKAEELIIMGLRLTTGIDKEIFKQICGINFDTFINQNFKNDAIKYNLIEENNQHIKVTPKGFLLIDYLTTGLCS